MRHLTLITILFFQCSSSTENACPKKICDDYSTQAAAQVAYDADKECLSSLDDNNDGTACEHLPPAGTGNGCSATANCGCSNKTKNQCASACCKWFVGTGCVCK